MIVLFPASKDPELSEALRRFYPPGHTLILPNPAPSRAEEILRVIYWVVSGRLPTQEELLANRPPPPPRSDDIHSKWILDVRVPHKAPCPMHQSRVYDPFEQIGFAEVASLLERPSTRSSETRAILENILSAMNGMWDGDEIEGSTLRLPLENLRATLSDALKGVPPRRDLKTLSEPFSRSGLALALLEAHRTCSADVLLEVEWGW